MKNKITQFSKFLFVGASVVLLSFSAKGQDLMQDSDVKTGVSQELYEASNGPKSLLSPAEVKEIQYAAPLEAAPEAASKTKEVKKASKMNVVKAAIAVAKINKMIKKAELKESSKSEKVKAGGGGISSRLKLGILLAAIGLIVAILGGFISGILVALGVIVLIIGLVLIIIDLVEGM